MVFDQFMQSVDYLIKHKIQNINLNNWKIKRLVHTFLSHLFAAPRYVSSKLNIYSPLNFLTCFTTDHPKSCSFVHRNSKQMIIPADSCQIHLCPKICREKRDFIKAMLIKWKTEFKKYIYKELIKLDWIEEQQFVFTQVITQNSQAKTIWGQRDKRNELFYIFQH